MPRRANRAGVSIAVMAWRAAAVVDRFTTHLRRHFRRASFLLAPRTKAPCWTQLAVRARERVRVPPAVVVPVFALALLRSRGPRNGHAVCWTVPHMTADSWAISVDGACPTVRAPCAREPLVARALVRGLGATSTLRIRGAWRLLPAARAIFIRGAGHAHEGIAAAESRGAPAPDGPRV